MADEPTDVRGALSDIALMRRVLDQVEQDRADTNLFGITVDANLLLQGLALGGVLILLVLEVFGNPSISRLVDEMRSGGPHLTEIGLLGFGLCMLLILLYFVLWRAARHSGEEMLAYTARNFRYARSFSFMSDLLMKFMFVWSLVFLNQAHWIAPLLLAFTGDYLLQGRFFTLSNKVSAVLGVLCIGGAALQFLYAPGEFGIPLTVFAVICAASLIKVVVRYRQQSSATA